MAKLSVCLPPVFAGPAATKLDTLVKNGFRAVGFAMQNDDGSRCWIDSAGVVLWPRTQDQANADDAHAKALQFRVSELEDALELIVNADDTCNLGWRLVNAIRVLEGKS